MPSHCRIRRRVLAEQVFGQLKIRLVTEQSVASFIFCHVDYMNPL